MTDRFSPVDLWRGHIKSLSFRGDEEGALAPDRVARAVLYGLPIALGVAAGMTDFTLKTPDGMLAGLSLLTGGLLVTFAQIASWRARLASRDHDYEHSEASDRDSLDEAATHVLVAALATVADIVAIIVGQSMMAPDAEGLTGLAGGIVVGLGVYVGLLFSMVIFKLYDTYVQVNRVSERVSGHAR